MCFVVFVCKVGKNTFCISFFSQTFSFYCNIKHICSHKLFALNVTYEAHILIPSCPQSFLSRIYSSINTECPVGFYNSVICSKWYK